MLHKSVTKLIASVVLKRTYFSLLSALPISSLNQVYLISVLFSLLVQYVYVHAFLNRRTLFE